MNRTLTSSAWTVIAAVLTLHAAASSAADSAVAPGDDFYSYVNRAWLASTVIPADVSRWDETRRLRESSALKVRDIVEQAAMSPSNPAMRKVGIFYTAYMDEAAIDAKGADPIRAELAAVSDIKTRDDLARAFARVERVAPPFGFGGGQSDFPVNPSVTTDGKDPTRYKADLSQGGLGLPDPEYYRGKDPALIAAREAYRTYIVTLFSLADMAQPERSADEIIALETKIASVQWPASETRDILKTYNVMQVTKLRALAPGFNWALYLSLVGLGKERDMIVEEPSALKGFAALVRSEPLESWRNYIALRVLSNAAPFLSTPFVDADFAFFEKALSGTPEPKPRWKRGVAFANVAMGEAIGQLYAERWFPASSKTAMQSMVQNIEAAMAARIDRLRWMAPATKVRAKAKLANLLIEIGYPDHWRSYTTLNMMEGDAAGNARRANAFEFDRQLGHLGHAVDRTEWNLLTTPQFADAFNYATEVKLVFPAAFLAPPFFDADADAAVNYGAIGAVIGHEVTHSFDDQGARLDERGRLASWWGPADETAFRALTDRLAAQYDAYEPAPGLHINGRLTLGENTADLGGLAVALDAYKTSLDGKPAPIIDGLTGVQRFFSSYARSFRELSRPEALRKQLLTNPHAPGRYRANTVRNIDDWYAAFDVQPGQAMALGPSERITIW